MHVRYAHNTPNYLGAIEQKRKRAPNVGAHLACLTILLPSCCAPARPSISSAPSLKVGPPPPCEPLRIAGASDTTALRKSTCHIPPCHEEYVALHALISHGVMTPQNPRPGPLACACPPPPSAPPQGTFLIVWRTLSSTSGRRYLGMPTRCIFARVRGLTAARDWWGDLSMQNTWLVGEGVASIMRPGHRNCIRLK